MWQLDDTIMVPAMQAFRNRAWASAGGGGLSWGLRRGGCLGCKRMQSTRFQQIGMLLLYCIEGVAVNTIGARWLGIVTIDVLRKDVPDEFVCPGHR